MLRENKMVILILANRLDKCVAAKSQKFSECHSGTVTKLFYYIELLCRTEI